MASTIALKNKRAILRRLQNLANVFSKEPEFINCDEFVDTKKSSMNTAFHIYQTQSSSASPPRDNMNQLK